MMMMMMMMICYFFLFFFFFLLLFGCLSSLLFFSSTMELKVESSTTKRESCKGEAATAVMGASFGGVVHGVLSAVEHGTLVVVHEHVVGLLDVAELDGGLVLLLDGHFVRVPHH